MITTRCPHCAGHIQMEEDQPVRFCPFCGNAVQEEANAGPSDLDLRLENEKNPKKKYRMITEALAADPDDFDANKALLFHGRLHEPLTRGKGLDFSIIKAHLLCVFDRPENYDEETLRGNFEELLRGEQLRRTMSLASNPDAFYQQYIRRLAFEYIDLFIRGDNKNSGLAFGFSRSAESTAKRCAPIVRDMLLQVEQSDRLTEAERSLLTASLREGFRRVFPGYESYLHAL